MQNRSPMRVSACLLGLAFAAAVAAQTTEKVVIDGSTGVAPLVEALARAYREQNPGAAIEIGKGLGTKARIQALREGRIDVAMASHGLNIAEVTRQGMTVHEIGKVAVVFGVNAEATPGNLTESQVCRIYAGKITNWKELGGSDLAIVPLARPESEVDTEVVRAQIGCLQKLEFADAVKIMPKAPDMARALASTPGSVGMTSMTVVEQSNGRVKALSLEGIAPAHENVQTRSYRLTRDSFLVTAATPASATARFLAFVRSVAGEKVIVANGAVPVR